MLYERENVTVLLIEDNEIDVMGVERAFRKSNLKNPIVVASDGVEALALLRDGRSIPHPYLILLDLNMPRMGGIEFLDEIRKDPLLRHAVVFVLTTSKAADDMHNAHARNIAGYFVKDKGAGGFINATHVLERYREVCEVPHAS